MSPYFSHITALLARAEATNAETIRECAGVIAGSLAAGGVLHAFGTGHSHCLAEELFHRAGGLIPVNALLDSRTMLHEGTMAATLTERLPGYAEAILSRYSLQAGEVMIVASNSGLNAASVEMALGAQARGLKVIALTSVAHSSSQSPRHASGKRLFEVANYVLDNCGDVGDAALALQGVDAKVSATSTVGRRGAAGRARPRDLRGAAGARRRAADPRQLQPRRGRGGRAQPGTAGSLRGADCAYLKR